MNLIRSHSRYEPTVQGIISRRLLLNYRVRPDAIRKLVPAPFRPQMVHGWAMAGICLIRLEAVRPRFIKLPFGVSSENAAHRIAVEWDESGGVRTGVYVPRRDTNSRINQLVGGRIFPGVHHLARFDCVDGDDRLSVEMRSHDGQTHVAVDAQPVQEWNAASLFRSRDEASEFFHCGSCGWSPGLVPGHFEGLELCTANWHITPLRVGRVESSFFDDPVLFPPGSVEFDCALLMRNIEHEWRPLGSINTAPSSRVATHHRHAAFFELP